MTFSMRHNGAFLLFLLFLLAHAVSCAIVPLDKSKRNTNRIKPLIPAVGFTQQTSLSETMTYNQAIHTVVLAQHFMVDIFEKIYLSN